MNLLQRFEKRLEQVVNLPFSKAFASQLAPVDIASRLQQKMDAAAVSITRARTLAPNEYTVKICDSDFQAINSWGAQALAAELQRSVTEYGFSQGYVFVGPLSVIFVRDTDSAQGALTITAMTTEGPGAPVAADFREPDADTPLLVIGGEKYLLSQNVTVIGRGAEADIVLAEPGISRRHLELRRGSGGTVVTDLGSTNGSFVEGNRISAATLVDGNTITIGRTNIVYWTSPAPNVASS